MMEFHCFYSHFAFVYITISLYLTLIFFLGKELHCLSLCRYASRVHRIVNDTSEHVAPKINHVVEEVDFILEVASRYAQRVG
jgi:hypothetical protein